MNYPRFACYNSLTKQLFTLMTRKYYIKHSKLKLNNNILPKLTPSVQFIHRTVTTIDNKNVEKEEPLLTKILKKMPFLNVKNNRINVTGFILYESIVDRINYAEFFEEFSLPDTFYSWFVVTELHLWMLTVRAMSEGEDGRLLRNSIIRALWTDVGLRIKKIGGISSSQQRIYIEELSEQFQAALIAYDEGLQSNDVVLAGALWRRLYQLSEIDPEHLDLLVKYIRKQTLLLDHISKNELFSQKGITWQIIT